MDKLIRAIIDAHYERCVDRCVQHMRDYPADGWVGDDSSLRTLWDHWKWEMQEEHNVFHALIEDIVEQIVRAEVDALSHEDGALMTLVTDAIDDLDEPANEPVFYPDAVERELMERVNERASNEPHRGEVQQQLDDEVLDRFERDNEPYRDRDDGP